MVNDKPTIILTFPRSGSSLVTKIFHEHGFNVGQNLLNESKANPDGFFENKSIKNCLKYHFGPPTKITENKIEKNFRSFQGNFYRILKNEGMNDSQWVLKLNSGYYDVMKKLFPDANFVCVRRNKESSFQSLEKNGFKYPTELWEWNIEKMLQAVEEKDAITVNYENLINNNYREIKLALKESKKEPNENILNATIKPELCHS